MLFNVAIFGRDGSLLYYMEWEHGAIIKHKKKRTLSSFIRSPATASIQSPSDALPTGIPDLPSNLSVSTHRLAFQLGDLSMKDDENGLRKNPLNSAEDLVNAAGDIKSPAISIVPASPMPSAIQSMTPPPIMVNSPTPVLTTMPPFSFINDTDLKERCALVFGMCKSLKQLAWKLSRSSVDERFTGYKTSIYRLHYYESPTGIAVVLMTDPLTTAATCEPLLRSIYSDYYVDLVVHNPLFDGCRSIGLKGDVPPIGNNLFHNRLTNFLANHAIFH